MMTPQALAALVTEIGTMWPTSFIRGHYGNATTSLEVVDDDMVVARASLQDGRIHRLEPPLRAAGITESFYFVARNG